MKVFELKIDERDVLVIGSALAKLPFETVAELITKLQLQINEQLKTEEATDES